jgi:tetratricopeptide (TPR) repeat protein
MEMQENPPCGCNPETERRRSLHSKAGYSMNDKKMKNKGIKIVILIVLLIVAAFYWLAALKEYRSLQESHEYYKRACISMEAGRIDEARDELTKSISAYPYSFEAYDALASIQYLKKDYDGAIEIYKSGLKYMPKDGKLCFELSRFYYMKEDYCRAQNYMERAQKLDPSLVSREFQLVYERAHKKMGRHTCVIDKVAEKR